MEIQDKIAIVTGAASGIGRALCQELGNRGIRAVAMVDLGEGVNDAAAELNETAGREIAVPYQGNVTDEGFRVRVFDDIAERFGRPHIVVPAAGITRDALAVKVDRETGKARVYPLEKFHEVVEVNLVAPVYWAMELIARIAEERAARGLKKWDPSEGVQGNVVFIGSISSTGIKGQISYSSTKAGLEGAAATLGMEAIFHGVRCGVIHPGFTETPMVTSLGEDYIKKHILPLTQLGRLIRPSEIADAICFMISNSAVSGELWADAGWHPMPT